MKRIITFIILLLLSTASFSQLGAWYWSQLKSPGGGPVVPCTRTNILMQTTFEEANPFSIWNLSQFCCPYSLVNQTDTFQFGQHAMRVALKSDDPTTAGSKRAELQQPGTEGLNADVWFGAGYLFPSNKFPTTPPAQAGVPAIIVQWHHNGSGSPPFAIWAWQGQFYCVTRPTPTGNEVRQPLGPIPQNQWVNIVIHYNQRSDNAGVIQIWIDKPVGSPTYQILNQQVSFPNVSNYLKIGVYKWQWEGSTFNPAQQTVFYIDNIRLGGPTSGYCSVFSGNYP